MKDKFKYHFDNFMASGPSSIFFALIVLFLVAFGLTSLLRLGIHALVLESGETIKTAEDVWVSFLQITDPGAVEGDSAKSIYLKLVGIFTILLGLVFFSAVIAFITTQLDMKIEDLKKGRSRVIEKDHILILGWGEMVTEIIRELIMANESKKRAAVVVLSETPKEEMDDYFSVHIPDRLTTKIITRTGLPSSLEALARVGVTDSKAVIILPHCNDSAPEEDKIISDSKVLKTILGVVAASTDDKTKANIVAQIFDKTKRDVMINLSPDKITMVDAEDIVAKMIVQTSRSTGLSVVYSDIIGFHGSEIYFHREDWQGQAFGTLQFSFHDGIPMGVRDQNGVKLNVPADHVMQPGQDLVIIAEDETTIKLLGQPEYNPREIETGNRKLKKRIERELIIGWNSKAPIIVEQYTHYILANSVIDIVLSDDDREAQAEIRAIKRRKPRHKINIIKANPLNVTALRKLKPHQYDNVIILNKIEDDTEKVDSQSITILLLLNQLFKQIEEKTGGRVHTQLISEVMNSENLELVSRTGVNDSIISYQMVSKIVAQVGQNQNILGVYDDLFQDVGAEIYLKPVSLYFKDHPEEVRFADLMFLAQKRKEVCIGYRHKSLENSIEHNFGVRINPKKDILISPHTEDCLIVLAEDEL